MLICADRGADLVVSGTESNENVVYISVDLVKCNQEEMEPQVKCKSDEEVKAYFGR